MSEKKTDAFERRERMYVVDQQDLITLLSAASRTSGFCIQLPRLDLPAGFEVISVHEAPMCRGFYVRIRHMLFAAVDAGVDLPVYGLGLQRDAHYIPRDGVDLGRFWAEHAEWSRAAFGSDTQRGPAGPLKHLVKEAQEASDNPSDVVEFADCLMLILDAARRAGHSFDSLLAACWKKLEINKTRRWPAADAADPAGPVEHVRT